MDYFNGLSDKEINDLSRALAHYAFRNGAVEDIHTSGNLTGADMKVLNKDVHNRIAGLLVALRDGRYDDVEKVLRIHALYGKDWDVCEPYMKEFDIV